MGEWLKITNTTFFTHGFLPAGLGIYIFFQNSAKPLIKPEENQIKNEIFFFGNTNTNIYVF